MESGSDGGSERRVAKRFRKIEAKYAAAKEKIMAERAKVAEEKRERKKKKRKHIKLTPEQLRADYNAYISSSAWQEKRMKAIAFYGSNCQKCSARLEKGQIEVHHITYERFKRERISDLMILCKPCHVAIHAKDVVKKPKRPRIKKPLM